MLPGHDTGLRKFKVDQIAPKAAKKADDTTFKIAFSKEEAQEKRTRGIAIVDRKDHLS